MLPSNQIRLVEQANLSYSALVKAFEKQIKVAEDQGRKEVEPLEALKQKSTRPKIT